MNKLEQAAWLALDVLENERCHVSANWDNIVKAITALREALSGDNVSPIEQAEQSQLADATLEPDYFGLTHDHTWLSIEKKQYDKLKPEGRMACYAAPVRTKDLTDDEIEAIRIGIIAYEPTGYGRVFARAVIAKFKEKNK